MRFEERMKSTAAAMDRVYKRSSFSSTIEGVEDGQKVKALRKQILANAALIFPVPVKKHLDTQKTTSAKPSEMFDVVIASIEHEHQEQTQAVLVYGDLLRRKVALRGPITNGLEAALAGMLSLTAVLVDGYCRSIPGRMKIPVKLGFGAEIDDSLTGTSEPSAPKIRVQCATPDTPPLTPASSER